MSVWKWSCDHQKCSENEWKLIINPCIWIAYSAPLFYPYKWGSPLSVSACVCEYLCFVLNMF
jgi:hypothetical protein